MRYYHQSLRCTITFESQFREGVVVWDNGKTPTPAEQSEAANCSSREAALIYCPFEPQPDLDPTISALYPEE